jgi:hypothetical protein
MGVVIYEALPGMKVGGGYNGLTHDPKVSVAVSGHIARSPGAEGQVGGADLVIVKDSEEFENALNIDTSASYGGLGLGLSAKFKFKKNCKVNRQSTFALIRCHATNAFEHFQTTPVLSPDAAELLRLGKRERFRERFGTGFISGRYTGGEFYGSIRIETELIERGQEIAAEMNASFGFFKAGVKVDSKKKQEWAKEKIQIFTLMAGGQVQPVFDIEQLFERATTNALAFSKEQGVEFGFAVEPYRELELPDDPLSFVEEQNKKEALRKLGEHFRHIQDLQNEIDFVLRNQEFFVRPKIDELNKANKDLNDELNTIVQAADKCARNPGECENFTPTIPQFEIPERKSKSKPPSTGGGAKKHAIGGLAPKKPAVVKPGALAGMVLMAANAKQRRKH